MGVRAAVRLVFVVASAIAILAAAGVPAGVAQEAGQAPPLDDQGQVAVQALVSAFERVAEAASVDDWPAADGAFNAMLDAIDAHRAQLEALGGETTVSAFARLDDLIDAVVAGLDAEDATAVQAAASMAVAELTALLPGAEVPAEVGVGLVLLDWRARIDAILALGEAGAWRDMRNAAMDLTADVIARGPVLTRALGEASGRQVDVVRVFAMRLRMAALEQSMADARSAAGHAGEALERLDRRPEDVVSAGPPPLGLTARAYQVQGSPGRMVVVPIVLQDVPQIGLGAVTLEVGWSPRALRLLDVGWDVGEGAISRDDVLGRVELRLPPAPVGPSGDVIVARLRFEAIAGRVDPRDYLPSDTIGAMESAMASAREYIRTGDSPRASAALAGAYEAFVGGRDRPASLYEALAQQGLADALWSDLLQALDLVTQPADTDRIVVALDVLEARMTASWTAHLAALDGARGVPITVRVLSVADTAGTELPVSDAVPGLVLLSTSQAQATPDAPGATAMQAVGSATPAGATPAGGAATAAAGGRRQGGEVPSTGDGLPVGMPWSVIVAFLVAAVGGLAAAGLGGRESGAGAGRTSGGGT